MSYSSPSENPYAYFSLNSSIFLFNEDKISIGFIFSLIFTKKVLIPYTLLIFLSLLVHAFENFTISERKTRRNLSTKRGHLPLLGIKKMKILGVRLAPDFFNLNLSGFCV